VSQRRTGIRADWIEVDAWRYEFNVGDWKQRLNFDFTETLNDPQPGRVECSEELGFFDANGTGYAQRACI